MLGIVFDFFSRNLLPSSRKRRVENVSDDEPCAKLMRSDDNFPTEIMACGDKENEVLVVEDDEITVLNEVAQPQWLYPRKTIHLPGAACTSTPISSCQPSQRHRPSLSRSQKMVAMAHELQKEKEKEKESDPEIQVLKHRRSDSQRRSSKSFRSVPTDRNLHSVRPKTIGERIFGPFRNSCSNSMKHSRTMLRPARQYKEMMQYRELLAKFQEQSPSLGFVSPVGSEDRRKKRDSPEQIAVVDLTQDVRINRESEKQPSTAASRAANQKEISIVEERWSPRKPVQRANSLDDYIRLHPSFAEITDVSTIISKHASAIAEKKRLASVEETRLAILSPHNQKAINMALEERMRDYMKITEPPILEIDEKPKYVLPELTEEQEMEVDEALVKNPAREVLVESFGLKVTRHDMYTLQGSNWLNDEVINFYMNLIIERGKNESLPNVYAFNTFFYPRLISGGHSALKRWTRKIDIFKNDFIFVPVHLGVHWCMAVADLKQKEVRYYDSMGSPNNLCLNELLSYLAAESLDKKKVQLDVSEWTKINVEKLPEQFNGSDCGVFACTFAEHLAREAELDFTQDDMPYFRRKMVLEILKGKLIT